MKIVRGAFIGVEVHVLLQHTVHGLKLYMSDLRGYMYLIQLMEKGMELMMIDRTDTELFHSMFQDILFLSHVTILCYVY